MGGRNCELLDELGRMYVYINISYWLANRHNFVFRASCMLGHLKSLLGSIDKIN